MSALLSAAAILLCSWAALGQSKSPPSPDLQRAAEVFKSESRAMGLREDSPVKAASSSTKGPRWHGRLFENFRNDFLDAVPHEVFQRGGNKAILRRNQFGGNISGPVLLPKLYDGGRATFFTFTYEGMREKIGRSSLRTIPTLPERTGDWSATVDSAGAPLPIYDPDTTAPNPAFQPNQPVTTDNLQYNRLPFPNNRMPTSRLDPVAVSALQYYPAPNSDAGPFFRNNYFAFLPEFNKANGIITRIDHNLGTRHRFGGGINYSNGTDGAAPIFETIANPGNAIRSRTSRRATVDHVFTKSAQTIQSVSLDVSSDEIENQPMRDANGRVFPNYRISPYTSMGLPTAIMRSARSTMVLTDGLSTRREKHRLRAVGRVIRERVNIYAPHYPEGAYTFTPGLTSLPGINNTGHAFASYLLGLSSFAEKSIVASPSYFRRSRFTFSGSDQVELRKGLNLSFSLGFEINTPRVERYNRQSTVSFSAINPANGRPGALIVAGENGQPRSFQPLRMNAEPSASLAWNIPGQTNTIVRTSYSRSYSAIPIYSVQWGTQAFNGTPTWISDNPQLDPAVRLRDGLVTRQHFPDFRPEAANDTVADLIEPTGRQPTYQSAGLSIEREFPHAFLITGGVGHSYGRNLLLGSGSSNPNAIHLDALQYRDKLNDEDFNRSLRPFPQYRRFDVYASWPEGRYKRDAAYVRVDKRATGGLSMSAYYEFSKQMDNYSGPYGVQDYYNRHNEWSLTAGNTPHRFTLTYNYELPIGTNRMLFAFPGWRRYIVDGWSLSGVTTLISGDPLYLRPQFNNTGNVVDALNVNVVSGVDPHVPNPGPDLWFNPAAFAQPADFTIGDASRTHPTLRMPANQNHDLAVNKRIPIGSEKSVELSMVGLNFVNHANWSNPDTMIGPASAPNVNAGKIISSIGGRVIQLGMRFSF
ncbi:MAG: hypothetical protein U0R19_41830 [Bryobacteraceae bacterium]